MILPGERFWAAEDYHQKYYLQRVPVLARPYLEIYPDPEDFAASTAVARLNGYVGGHGSPDRLEAEADELGLSAEGRRFLQDHLARKG